MAAYLCSLCKHFTNVDKNPYHCEKCGICRIHADKSFQCEVCNVCLDKLIERNHKCRPDSSHDECCICLEDVHYSCILEYLSSNRNVRTELEALNSVVPHIESNEEHSFPSSAFPSPSLNSLSVSLGDPFNLKKSTLASKLQEEPCEYSDQDLADGCLAKAQSKPEIKETHHYADVSQFKNELNGKENPDTCDSIDGVPKQPEEPLGESNECPDKQIKVQHHPQCQSSLEEMKVSAANGIGVRTPTNSGLDPFMLSKDEESATFHNNCFELLEQINKLKEQLRRSEAENQQLKAEAGQYLFLEDREKRSDKLLSVPRVSASDDSKSCGATTSSKCVTTNGRPLGGATSLQEKPDFNLQARFREISNSLSVEEFKRMKTLTRGKIDGFRLAKMKVGFELLKELERVSEHPCTDIGELLKEIQRFDLLEKLSAGSKISESAGISSLQELEQEQDKERCANRVSINMMDNDLLSMESVGTNDKEGICVPNSPNKSVPSSDCSNISVSSSGSLVAQGTTVCSNSSSQGSSEKSAKAPEVALTTCSAVAPGEIANESNLNTGSSEEEVPVQAQLLNSTNDLTDGGNIEVGDIEGQSLDLCYGASGTSRSNTRSPSSEGDLQISSSDSYAFCLLADPENSHDDDGNLVHLQQSSNAQGQAPLGMNGSDAASSSSTDWKRLGARPKSSQTQRSQVAISPPPPPLIGSPVSVGLAEDFVVRHSEDKANHESLFSNGRDFSFLGNDTSQGASFVEGSTNASEAYIVRPCFEPGTSSGCAVIVDNSGLPSPFSFSACRVSSRRVVSAATSRPPVVSASNAWSLVRNSSFSTISPGDGNASGTRLTPGSGNANENNSRGALFNGDNGTNNIEPVDDSLLALERRVADASAPVEQVLREREERQQFAREIEGRERKIRERRERERREREEREMQEVEEQEQEAFPSWVPMAL